jgi:hypothetical protein
VQKNLSALLARHLRRLETEFMSFDRRMLKPIGLDRSAIGPVPMNNDLERTNGVRRPHECPDSRTNMHLAAPA